MAYIAGFIIAAAVLTGCRNDGAKVISTVPVIDPSIIIASNAMQETSAFVSIGPRNSGSSGSLKSAEYLLQRMKAFGIPAVIDEFEDETPAGVMRFRNVVGTLKGRSERSIILVSHYDTKKGLGDLFVGANDSGSSTGLLLEMARALRQISDLHPTIILAFVDGEEAQQSYSSIDGLHGSRRLARQLKSSGKYTEIEAAIILDMIGDKDLTITVPRNCSPDLISMLFEAARTEGIRNNTELMQGIVYDDHVPFMAEGIKALNIMDFKFTGGTSTNFWHTDQDTMDKLSAESMAVSGRLAIRIINSIFKAQ